MARLLTSLVIVMATVAVTSAWPGSLFAREAPDEQCPKEAIRSVFYGCSRYATLPPIVHTIQHGDDIAASVVVEVIEQFCAVSAPDKMNCMRNWTVASGCPNAQEIVGTAERTGSFCDGDQPAAWLREGLLDRMTDLREDCFERVSLNGCSRKHQDTKGRLDLDAMIECFKTEIDPNCDAVAVMTAHLKYLLMDAADFGTEPSAETLNSLKDWP